MDSDDDTLRLRRSPLDPDRMPALPGKAKHRAAHGVWHLRLLETAEGALAECLALLSPVDCVCCGAEDYALCPGCERQVRNLTRHPFRAEAQAPALVTIDGAVILPVVAAGIYREELAQALLSFKKHGQGGLEAVLAKGLGRAIRAAAGDWSDVCLVPVPTSGSAYRKRGFSPVHQLLGNLRRHNALGRMTVQDCLRKTGGLAPGSMALETLPAWLPLELAFGESIQGGQKGLGRGARARRVRGSMKARKGPYSARIRGRPCLLVDDVLTTGATLAEAARAVRSAGGMVRGAVVLAATRPPDFAASSGAGPARPAPCAT